MFSEDIRVSFKLIFEVIWHIYYTEDIFAAITELYAVLQFYALLLFSEPNTLFAERGYGTCKATVLMGKGQST